MMEVMLSTTPADLMPRNSRASALIMCKNVLTLPYSIVRLDMAVLEGYQDGNCCKEDC